MSLNAEVPCDLDTSIAQARAWAKRIIEKVFEGEDIVVSDEEKITQAGFTKTGYGITVEIPREVAIVKYGLKYCPDSADGTKKVICIGREVKSEEAGKIQEVSQSPEFKQREVKAIYDKHTFGDQRDAARDELMRKISMGSGFAPQAIEVMKAVEAAKKYKDVPGDVEQQISDQLAAATQAGIAEPELEIKFKDKALPSQQGLMSAPEPEVPGTTGPQKLKY